MSLQVTRLTPAIGAEISGIDLAGPLSNTEASALHDALMAHQVIFFRDQKMSVEQHKAFGRLFGELLVHPAAKANVAGLRCAIFFRSHGIFCKKSAGAGPWVMPKNSEA